MPVAAGMCGNHAGIGVKTMPKYTVEKTYLLPVFVHLTVEAESAAEAAKLAMSDDNWDASKNDYDSCRPEFVSGIWAGEEAYEGTALDVPALYRELE
jgi:hypothetical protein